MTIRRTAASSSLVLVLLLLPLAVAGCSGGAPISPGSAGGVRSAEMREVKLDFSLLTPEGGSVDLGQYDGSVRLVDFWATWCPPCREAIPHLNTLYRKYKDQGVVFVGISVDESPKAVAAFEQDVRIEYPSVMSTEEAEKAFGGIAGLPATFILDRQGRVFQSYVGPVEMEILEGDIQATLAEK